MELLRVRHVFPVLCAIGVTVLTACTAPLVVNETSSRMSRIETEIYSLRARVVPRDTRILGVTATVQGRVVPMRNTPSTEQWAGDYFGNPCLGNTTYSYVVEYNQRDVLDPSGFSSRIREVVDPEIGRYVMTIDGPPIPGCPTTPARSFFVNSVEDSIDVDLSDGICADANGRCTLRAAVMQANASPGHDRIDVPSGRYLLTLEGAEDFDAAVDAVGDLDITDGVSIISAGSDVVVDANQRSRVFDAHAANQTVSQFSGLKIVNGRSEHAGGGIRNRGILRLIRVTLEGNVAAGETCGSAVGSVRCPFGHGIFNEGQLYVGESTIRVNGESLSGQGGGVFNFGVPAVAIIERSFFEDNRARFAEGIRNHLGSMKIINSTFFGHVGHAWGLITNADGNVLVRNTTISGNPVDDEDARIFQSTRSDTAELRVENSLVAPDRALCRGRAVSVVSGGFNVIGVAEASRPVCFGEGLSFSDAYDSRIFLDAPAFNGVSPTKTIRLREDFPFLDFGAVDCPRDDQRSRLRPIDGNGSGGALTRADCDPGASEFDPSERP